MGTMRDSFTESRGPQRRFTTPSSAIAINQSTVVRKRSIRKRCIISQSLRTLLHRVCERCFTCTEFANAAFTEFANGASQSTVANTAFAIRRPFADRSGSHSQQFANAAFTTVSRLQTVRIRRLFANAAFADCSRTLRSQTVRKRSER